MNEQGRSNSVMGGKILDYEAKRKVLEKAGMKGGWKFVNSA